jgi:hypothetical protein
MPRLAQGMSLRPKLPPKRDRSAEFSTFTPKPRAPAQGLPELRQIMVGVSTLDDLPRPLAPKVQGRKRQDIRDSARGEECTVRIAGICRGGTEHTIWSHAPLGAAGKGRSIKSLDLAGAYCCTACDAALDQAQRPPGMSREQVLLDWFFGHMRSLVRLAQKGLLR